MNPPSYLIIGCGHFGSQAAEKLLKKDPHSRITVVDKDQKAIQKISSLPVETILGEGISSLRQCLIKGQPIDYIIPAVPLHLAFEFLLVHIEVLRCEEREGPSPFRVAQCNDRQNR